MKPWNKKRVNSLLIKDDVGKSKSSVYTLPGNEFYFGKPSVPDLEGAQQITMTWQFHNLSQDQIGNRDFTKLNKMCLSNMLHKPNQYSEFRKSTDAREVIRKGTNNYSINLPDQNHRYGKPYAPQSPMKLIIGNSYANHAEQVMETKYDHITKLQQKQQRNSRPSSETKHTRASELAQTAIKNKIMQFSSVKKTLYKLSQFDTVTAKTQTRKFHKSDKQQQQYSTHEL